jgi:hypothetical protein
MKLSARTAALYSVTFAGLLMLSACGKNEPQTATQPAATSTAPAPAAASTASKPAAPSTAAAPAAPSTAPAASSTAGSPAAAVAPTTAPTEAFKVATITLGDTVTPDHKVRKAVTTFAPNQKTLYLTVDTEGHTDGATLSAKWSYLEGKGQLVTTTSQSIATDGSDTTTFKVQNPNLWPEGKYKVDILLDGKQVASQDFEVKKR